MATDERAEGGIAGLLRRHYDLVSTASTAGVFLIVGVPWPLWAIWCGVLSYQIGNRLWARQ